MKFGTDIQHLCQMSQLNFERSRSKFKVKTAVLTSNLPLAKARRWLRYLHPIWQSERSTFGKKYASQDPTPVRASIPRTPSKPHFWLRAWEVLSARNMPFNTIQDCGMRGVCILWVLF